MKLIPSSLHPQNLPRQEEDYLPFDSTSAEENPLTDEQVEVGSPSKEDEVERFDFYGKPQAHRPITRAKNKLRLRFKLMENSKLKDLVINIDDTPIKEEPPKPKKVKDSRPRKPSKVKMDKEKGLMLWPRLQPPCLEICRILTIFGHF